MSERLLLCTRKGVFIYARGTAGWSVSYEAFLGVPVSMALHDGRDGNLYAALAHGHFGCKLHRSGDGGATWDEITMPSFPAGVAGSDGDGPAVSLVWALEAAGSDAPETLWAGTIPGGLFVSTDRGDSWTLVRSLWDLPERANWFGGGYDDPGIHSIAIDPRDSHRISLAVSCGGVWLSEDGGGSWVARTRGMKAPYVPPERAEDAAIQDPHRLVQCPAQPDRFWVQHHAGVYRSTDGLESWSRLDGG